MKCGKAVKRVYKTLFYFELGKGQVARVYQWVPDVFIILGGLKLLFDIEFSKGAMGSIVIGGVLLMTGFGFFLKHTGLWDVDQYVKAKKDPVFEEILRAARRINKEGTK